MFKIPEKKIIVNYEQDLRLLENNPVAVAPVTVIGEGTSYDDFDGWGAGKVLRIEPISAHFTLEQLVEAKRTMVKADNTIYTALNPNYSAVTNGSIHNPPTVVSESVTVRRASPQTATFTVTSAPVLGSQINLVITWRSKDRNPFDENHGPKSVQLSFEITSALSTPALIADYIKRRIDEYNANNNQFPAIASVAGAVITLVGKKDGVDFNIYQSDNIFSNTILPSTFTITVPSFAGVNNFYWVDAYQQSVDGWYSRRDRSDVYLPIKGVYYQSYFFKYRHYSGYDEQQQSSVNVEQNHLIDLKIYVNPALTSLITKLDLVGGW